MAMRVDQAGQQRPALGVDDICVAKLQHFAMEQPFHLAVVADQDAGEALQLAIRIDLDAVDVGDQRVGEGG